MIRLFCFLFALVVSSAFADQLTGRVVSIADGDTITVLDAANQQHKIRLAGIDAPEKKQPYGDRSKQHLASLVFDRQVTVNWDKTDRYQRIIGKILVNGTDANLEQLRAGMAWWYEKYRKEQSPADQRRYSEAGNRRSASGRTPIRPHPGSGATAVVKARLPNF